MKKGNTIVKALAVIAAGSMIYTAQPAEAKGILSKLGLKIDEISITLKNKNSTSSNNTVQTPKPEPCREEYREPPHHEPHHEHRETPPRHHWGR